MCTLLSSCSPKYKWVHIEVKTEYNNYLAGKVESLDDMMAEYEVLEQESEAVFATEEDPVSASAQVQSEVEVSDDE